MTDTARPICPICGEGYLDTLVGKQTVEYKGSTGELDTKYSVCDACGTEQADATQTRDNKRAMIAFKKKVDGLLSGAEVREIRERLGLSQSKAASIFGGGPVAFSKYENDDVMQSDAMDNLLRLISAKPDALKILKHRPTESPRNSDPWTTVKKVEPQRDRPSLKIVRSTTPQKQNGEWKKAV